MTTRVRSTPSSASTRWVVVPPWLWTLVCTVMGAPVATWAWATARITRSTPGVSPGSSMAHLRKAALTEEPAIPSVMSRTKRSTMGSSPSIGVPGPANRRAKGRSV